MYPSNWFLDEKTLSAIFTASNMHFNIILCPLKKTPFGCWCNKKQIFIPAHGWSWIWAKLEWIPLKSTNLRIEVPAYDSITSFEVVGYSKQIEIHYRIRVDFKSLILLTKELIYNNYVITSTKCQEPQQTSKHCYNKSVVFLRVQPTNTKIAAARQGKELCFY